MQCNAIQRHTAKHLHRSEVLDNLVNHALSTSVAIVYLIDGRLAHMLDGELYVSMKAMGDERTTAGVSGKQNHPACQQGSSHASF